MTKRRSRSRLLALEPRVLFDGALADTTAAIPKPADSHATADAPDISRFALPAAVEAPAAAPAPAEWLIVDSRVPDAAQLVANARPGMNVLLLDRQRDGLEQIGQALANAGRPVGALHIVSTGAPGSITLGAAVLDEAQLDRRAAELGAMQQWLTADAHVVLYGSNVATTGVGDSFVRDLARLTGADVAAGRDPAPLLSGVAPVAPRVEIIFVDAAVADIQPYLVGKNAEVVTLQAGRDGVDQIAAALQGRTDISAIHIVSHGDAGQLLLGSTTLTAQGISQAYAADMAVIGAALASDGDILVYGCQVGEGEAGQAFTAALAAATGADVQASTDDTGATALGGNWTLESSTGAIETLSVTAADWNGMLNVAAANGSGALLGATGNSIYSIDILTGKATLVTTVPGTVGGVAMSGTINSLAVDQVNGLIYYCDSETVAGNAALFAYDYRTVGIADAARHILIDANMTNNGAGASITVGNVGVGGGSATFANGTLYLGVESNGAVAGTGAATDDTIYRISFAAGGRAITTIARLVSPITGTDWGDLGYDVANNTIQSISGNTLTRYNALTGAVVTPSTAIPNAGNQAGESASGNTYRLSTTIQEYNRLTGASIGAAVTITTNGTTALAALTDAAGWTPPTSSIGDVIFDDNNSNAVFDAGDVGIAGVTVQLVDDVNNNGVVNAGDRILATDTTSASGAYLFTNVLPGNYIVRVTDTGAVLGSAAYTTAGPLNATADVTTSATNSAIAQNLLNIDFGVNNRVPVNTVPAAQTVAEDAALTIAGLAVSDPDGNIGTTRLTVTNGSLTVSLTGGATISAGANGSSTLTLSGTQAQINSALTSVSFAPTADFNGAATLTVLSTDKAGSSDSDTVGITVNAVADIADDVATTAEDTAATINVLGNDSFENVGRTITAVNGTAIVAGGASVAVTNGSVALNAGGQLVFTPAANFNGAVPVFTYTVTSGGVTETANVNVTVTAVNDAPVNTVPGAAQSTAEDTPLAISGVTVADIDSGALTSTVSVTNGILNVTTGGGATITNNGTGSVMVAGTAAQINAALAGLTYTNTADYNGAATLTVVTSDDSLSDTDTIGITVNAVADIADDVATTAEDTAVTIAVLTNDSFENAGRIITAVNGSAIVAGGASVAVTNGSVALNAGGQLIFTPTANFNGAVPVFTYTVTSGGVTETANVSVTVTAVNDAPVNTVPGAQVTGEDTPLAIGGVSVADVDSGSLTSTVSVTSGILNVTAGGGATVTNNGTGSVTVGGTAAQINAALAGLTYTNTADYNGAATLTLVTTDGSLGDTDTVAITVNAVADIADDVATTAEDTAATIAVLTNDSFENAGRTITAVNGTAIVAGGASVAVTNGSVALNASGQLIFTPTANFNGAVPVFTYTVTSGGVTETANVSVTVTAVNDAPVNTVPGAQATAEDTPLAIPGVTVADVDGGTLTSTVSVTNGILNVTTGGGATITNNGTGSITVAGTAAQINAALAGLTYTNTDDYNGAATLTVLTTDGSLSDTDTVAITVNAVADIADDVATTAEDTAVTIAVLSNDTFKNAGRTITAVNGTAIVAGGASVAVTNGSVALNAGGQLIFTPTANFNGVVPVFTYTVTSGGVSETANVSVTVTAVNDAPVNTVPGAAQSTAEDTPLAIGGVSVADVDGGALTSTVSVTNGVLNVTTGGGATITNNGTGSVTVGGTAAQINAALAGLTYTNTADYNGAATLTLVTSDTSLSDTDTVGITVNAVADIADDVATTAEDTAVTIGVLTNDSFENAGRTITAVNGSAIVAGGASVAVTDGSVALNASGQLIFTPTANYNGAVPVFTYTVTSGGVTETANVSVTVTAV
ncbi:MAG: hypothetical protein JWQ13_3965, partial [Ramlibacter sp.]|nr:hypothetical protein [Ramlibacter sp.]